MNKLKVIKAMTSIEGETPMVNQACLGVSLSAPVSTVLKKGTEQEPTLMGSKAWDLGLMTVVMDHNCWYSLQDRHTFYLY